MANRPRAPVYSSGAPPLRVSEPGGAAPQAAPPGERRPRALTRSGGGIFFACWGLCDHPVPQFPSQPDPVLYSARHEAVSGRQRQLAPYSAL